MSYQPKSSRRDHLTLTTKDGKIDLTEQELSRVAGGLNFAKVKLDMKINGLEFLKYTF